MRTNIGRRAAALAAVALLWVAAVAAQDANKIKGIIVGRNGATMTVKGDSGPVTVTLSDNTKVVAVKGRLGVRKDTLGLTALIPGLPVEVETGGATDGGLAAVTVRFKADDLKTAHAIQAGLAPTAQQVAANGQQIQATDAKQAALSTRVDEFGEYDVKGEATAYFAVSSAELSQKSKDDLKALSTSALALKGYMIQVAGYTDSTGNLAKNQALSDRRAESVITFLQQSCGIPLFRVLAPAAMGVSNPAGSNTSAQGQAENRRVVTKVLVNKGVAAGSQ